MATDAVQLATRTTPSVYIQDACYLHRYIRSTDTSLIVERPERLRAVKVGVAAAIARLDSSIQGTSKSSSTANDQDELTAALDKLNISPSTSSASAVKVIHSSALLPLTDPSVTFIHGQDSDYLSRMTLWSSQSAEKIASGESEIPEGLPQGDLYMCPESLKAIQGALGTVVQAVDDLFYSPPPNAQPAFVAVRPPGHHCGEDTPMGFCFVNNVMVGAAHAWLKYGVKKIVVFDIDLHHGNGTQSISWAVNEETYRKKLEVEAAAEASSSPPPSSAHGPQILYTSLHDILSFPCEDGNASMIQAASTKIHGQHGQWIDNVHLEPWHDNEEEFDRLYETKYSEVFSTARKFVGGDEDYLVFISCGFDACEHEHASMSRHGANVPTKFYHRFALDALQFAKNNRVISVLEGGYSDRALTSGSLSHLAGLANIQTTNVKDWWSVSNLEKLETATKKTRGGINGRQLPRSSLSPPTSSATPSSNDPDAWLDQAIAHFLSISANEPSPPPKVKQAIPPSSRTLRDRGKGGRASTGSTPSTSALAPVSAAIPASVDEPASAQVKKEEEMSTVMPSASSTSVTGANGVRKVVLKLGPRPPAEAQ